MMYLTITCCYPLTTRKNTTKLVIVNSFKDNFIETCYKAMDFGTVITFNRYYENSAIMFEGNMFPYILREGKYIWNVRYDEVSVDEFLNTHQLSRDEEIIIEIDNVGGAGELFQSLYQEWISILPILKDTLEWVGSVWTVYEIVRHVRKSFGKKKKDKPKALEFYKFIVKRNRWNLQDLIKQLDADEELVKIFLMAAGYEEVRGIFTKNESKNRDFEQLFFAPQKELYYNHGLNVNCYSINNEIYNINLNITYIQILCNEKNSFEILNNIKEKILEIVSQRIDILKHSIDYLSINTKEIFPCTFNEDDEMNLWFELNEFNIELLETIKLFENEMDI